MAEQVEMSVAITKAVAEARRIMVHRMAETQSRIAENQ